MGESELIWSLECPGVNGAEAFHTKETIMR